MEILISYAVTNLGVLIVQTISVTGLINGAFQVRKVFKIYLVYVL